MKNHKLLLFLLTGQLLASSLAAQIADGLVSAGRTCLVAHNLIGAYSNFNAAVALSPTNEAANALVAVTRILVLPQQPAGSNFLNSLKLSTGGRDIYNWTSTFPHDINGHVMLPTNNTSVAIAFYRTNIMAALGASRTNLAQITDPNFTLSLTKDETSIESVTVDYGDFLLMQALERVAEFAGYTLTAHNFNFVFSHLQDLDKTNGLTIQKVLSDYPSLLNLSNTTDLVTSKGIFTNAIVLYQQASDFIRNVRPPGAVRLFNLEPNDIAKEAKFRANLTNVLLSLNAPTEISPNNANAIASTAYLGAYFAGTHSLRSLIPQFNGNAYVNDTLPDYTFGGIVPDWPAYETEAKLRKMFYSYAGIYVGHVDDLIFDDPGAGSFAVFVGTNQQATIVGYDTDSFETFDGDQSGGVSAQFNVDKHGNWQFSSNSPDGVIGSDSYGSFSKDGSVNGVLTFTNGDSVFLNGCGQRALENAGNNCYSCHDAGTFAGRSFQNAAGNYSGTWSGAFGGQSQSGTLMAILSADGQIDFCVFHNGAQYDGGQGQFGSNNRCTTTDTSGSTISATLTNATLKIGGSGSNPNGSAKGTLTRSASVPFDVLPAITTPPQNKNVTAGSNVTFSVTATGSAPLCYQWYCNDSLILGATSASLVVTNAPLSASGNSYSVSINNVVGGTNSTATLTVVPETVKPTLQITAPTSGLHVSNSTFTVTGTASDNVAVSNVLYQLNNTGWNPATPANQWANWTAPVTLIQGSNTIQAYAVDTSGNVSTTNTVIFDYIVSAVLTVNTNGSGTVSPNYNGGWLQIGQNYAMTAKPGTGFAFVNWTGSLTTNGATLKFTMTSNLTFIANFVDTNKPTVSITNLTASQRVSNVVFTVMGKAGDNWQVSSVVCQINGGGWNLATNINNWTNWAAGVTLVPGTNVVQVYAMDTSGNISTTNSVSFQYVVSAPLQVQMTGLGTVSPNYSNAVLALGQSYSMTAKPGTGFMFTNWAGGTGLPLVVLTNKAALQFVMQSNLVLQANFVDTNKPVVSITNLASGQRVSNAVFTVMGKAGDNWQVSSVVCQINGGGWNLATNINNWTNWAAGVTLVPGTNVVQVYAMDTSGNISTTNSVSFQYVVSAPLQVQMTGLGTVSPNYSNAVLALGQSYSMTAKPGTGFMFTNWAGGTGLPLVVLTNKAALQFVMQSNLVLQANFVDTNKPVVSITNLASGQRVSNAVFTVMGKAGDNWQVSSVVCQINGGGWNLATNINNWTNWAAGVTLVPGTNVVQVYAMDTSGNISTTNSVSFQYVVSAPLQVQMTGLGTVSPNYSNAVLALGQSYSMTAKPGTGFMFTNWAGGTGLPLVVLTNKAALQFVMQSNLVLQANFVSTNRPVVAFTITPTTVSNTYNGTITLKIVGLTNKETVVVQKFLDLNTNGVIDGGDWMVQQFTLQDGTNFVIGGVTNFNVPGDLNATTGAITAMLNFQGGDSIQNIAANYLFRLSSPVGRFAPMTNSLSVTNFPYAQKFTGNVVSNGASTTVPNAVVLLFPPGASGPPVEGTVADNTGSYTLWAPPGTYSLCVFKSNYVGNMKTAPVFALSAGQTVTTNLTLTNATSSISGQVVDVGNSSIGLPGVMVPAQSANGLIAVTFTDTNGNFNVPVTAGNWKIKADDTSLIVHGYLGLENKTNVTAGATGITIAVPKATALVYGSVQDNLGNPFAGLDVYANDQNNLYQIDAYTDANGNYVLGVLGLGSSDSWWVEANGNNQLTNYIFSPQNVSSNINAGQAVLQNFTAILATNYISGHVQQSNGNPIVGVGVWASATINSLVYGQYVDTDADGNYSMNVGDGSWMAGVECGSNGGDGLDDILGSGSYLCPANQSVVISNNNSTANFTVILGTNHISGQVQDSNGNPIVGVNLTAYATINGINYQMWTDTDTNGNYSFSVVNGAWNISIACNGGGNSLDGILGSGNYQCPTNQTADIDDNNATNNFTVAILPLRVTSTSLAYSAAGVFYTTQLTAAGGQPPYTWSLSPGSALLPANLSLSADGYISGTPLSVGICNFSVRVTDGASQTADQALSLVTTVSIADVAGETTFFAASQPVYCVTVTNGSVVVPITRSGILTNTFCVNYSTTSGTAVAGVDYSPVSGEICWPPNVTSTNIVVPIFAKNPTNVDATIILQLSSEDGNVVQNVLLIIQKTNSQPKPALALTWDPNPLLFIVPQNCPQSFTISNDGPPGSVLNFLVLDNGPVGGNLNFAFADPGTSPGNGSLYVSGSLSAGASSTVWAFVNPDLAADLWKFDIAGDLGEPMIEEAVNVYTPDATNSWVETSSGEKFAGGFVPYEIESELAATVQCGGNWCGTWGGTAQANTWVIAVAGGTWTLQISGFDFAAGSLSGGVSGSFTWQGTDVLFEWEGATNADGSPATGTFTPMDNPVNVTWPLTGWEAILDCGGGIVLTPPDELTDPSSGYTLEIGDEFALNPNGQLGSSNCSGNCCLLNWDGSATPCACVLDDPVYWPAWTHGSLSGAQCGYSVDATKRTVSINARTSVQKMANSASFVFSNTFPLQLGFAATQPMASNGLKLNLRVPRGLNGRIEVSTNLVNWTTLTNFIGTNTTLNFRDPAATNFKSRFYRAVVP